MAPSKLAPKANPNAKKPSNGDVRKPPRLTSRKSQLLISRFFSAKSPRSQDNVAAPSSSSSSFISVSQAKRVNPPKPANLPSKPVRLEDAGLSDQPRHNTQATYLSTGSTDIQKDKHIVPSSAKNVAEDDEPVEVRRPRKRLRRHPECYRDLDEELKDANSTWNIASIGTAPAHEDPDFAVKHLAKDVADHAATNPQNDQDDPVLHQDAVHLDDSEQSPNTQHPCSALASYGSHRSSHAGVEHAPRDARRQHLFKQRFWPLGKRSLALKWAAGLEGNINPTEGEHPTQSKAKIYTPLESQFVRLRKQHPDMLLVIECGYKYRMFDGDASVASKVLRVAAYFDRNFLTASFPTHRLPYHVNRLVQAGYKVGVVKQSETAALKKASSKASSLFQRELASIYTKGTMVADGRLNHPRQVSADGSGVRTATYIMAILEADQRGSTISSVSTRQIAFAAVDSVTGRVVCDAIMDDMLRSELMSRLTALEPVEILMSIKECSQLTESVVKAFVHNSGSRIERLTKSSFTENESLSTLNRAVKDQWRGCQNSLQPVLDCLGALCKYLSQFGLERFLTNATDLSSSRSSPQMSLGAEVLRNFEVLGNSNNGSVQGSLFGLLNRTKTAAGSRQMRQWVCHPLVSPRDITERLEAVDYLRSNMDNHEDKDESGEVLLSNAVVELLSSLSELPDLEQGFLRITCGKCTPSEFLGVIRAFEDVGTMTDRIKGLNASSILPVLLQNMLSRTPRVDDILKGKLVSCLNQSAAANDTYHELFLHGELGAEHYSDNEESVKFFDLVQRLGSTKHDLEGHERSMSELLTMLRRKYSFPNWEWKKVAKEEFLLELPVSEASSVPRSWPIISQTKSVKRFRPPQATKGYDDILCARETRDALSSECWQAYLELFAAIASPLRVVVRTLVNFDCLSALASVANLPCYSRPEIESPEDAPAGLQAEGVRHPLAEALESCRGYVPNDVHLGRDRAKIGLVISGPNYGGKSSYARMTALLVILAQVGSFVPARRAVLNPFDSIYARMGSKDSIGSGMSSLMVELAETSRILSHASSRSLVVIDELGRGTSTHDGTAIAYATLSYLVQKIRCVALFITHYPMVTSLQSLFPKLVGAFYMDYREDRDHTVSVPSGHSGSESTQFRRKVKITFLYKLTEGVASCSYGLNVAQLANLPGRVIEHARRKAFEFESKIAESKSDSDLAQLLNESTWRSTETVANVLRLAEATSEL